MPRRKKNKHRRIFQSPVSREQQLKDRCSSLGWELPFHLRNWQNHFVSKPSYMHEFERWLAEKCRLNGAYVKVIVEIEDDYWPTNQKPDEYEESWNDYWGGGRETARYAKYGGYLSKWTNTLPMKHKIAAPSGDVGSNLVCI